MIKVISTAESYRQMKHSIDCAVLNCFSPIRLFVTLWTVACQVPLSMGFPRQEYWSWFPFPTLGIFLTQGSNPRLLHLLHWQVEVTTSHLGSLFSM